jgi:DNA-binding PadR family transcriptional regulator
MERDGLITRRRDAADERRVLIDLTEKGRQLQTRALEVPRSLARQLSIEPQALDGRAIAHAPAATDSQHSPVNARGSRTFNQSRFTQLSDVRAIQ